MMGEEIHSFMIIIDRECLTQINLSPESIVHLIRCPCIVEFHRVGPCFGVQAPLLDPCFCGTSVTPSEANSGYLTSTHVLRVRSKAYSVWHSFIALC